MTEELIALRKKMDQCKAVYDGLGSQNVSNRTLEDLVAIDISVHQAKRAWLDAYSEYQRALEAFVQP